MGINKWFIDMLGMIGVPFYFAVLFNRLDLRKKKRVNWYTCQ